MPKVSVNNNLLLTTAFENTCAFGAGSNLIVEKLLALTEETLHAGNSALLNFADTFGEYYNLQAPITLTKLQTIFRQFTNVQDQQLILAPVLRAYLLKLISSDEAVKTKLFNDGNNASFIKALRTFINDDATYSAIYRSNPSVFARLQTQFNQYCADENLTIDNREGRDIALSQFLNEKYDSLEKVWNNECVVPYANFVGGTQCFLEGFEAAIVYNNLNIHVDVRQPATDVDGFTVESFMPEGGKPVAHLQVNIKTNHYETFENNPARVAQHNTDFPLATLAASEVMIRDAVQAVFSAKKKAETTVVNATSLKDLKAEWKRLVEEAERESDSDDEQSDAASNASEDSNINLISYSYKSDTGGLHIFSTSKKKQEALDAKLAALIDLDKSDVEFKNLPRSQKK